MKSVYTSIRRQCTYCKHSRRANGAVQAAHELFGMGRENIDLTFGGVTIGTAVVATLVGGWALDWVGSSIKNAMLLNGRPIPALMARTSDKMHPSWIRSVWSNLVLAR